MGDGGKGSGEAMGASKCPSDDVQGVHSVSDTLWEKNMGDHGRNDEVTGRFSPSDFQRDCGDNSTAGLQKVMEVGLSVSGKGGDKYMADKGVLAEASVNHGGVCCGLSYL